MRRTCAVAALLALIAVHRAAGASQATSAPLPPASKPPVLSTVPEPPAGATPEPGQMSGVPLQVGDLPPGIVAVRVIRRSFQDNVPGQQVRLRTAEGGRVLSAVTGADGRAQFDGLRIGERIQVRAAVGSETLESGEFQIPAEGGVRLVLVAALARRRRAGPTGRPTPPPCPRLLRHRLASQPLLRRRTARHRLRFFGWLQRSASSRLLLAYNSAAAGHDPTRGQNRRRSHDRCRADQRQRMTPVSSSRRRPSKLQTRGSRPSSDWSDWRRTMRPVSSVATCTRRCAWRSLKNWRRSMPRGLLFLLHRDALSEVR